MPDSSGVAGRPSRIYPRPTLKVSPLSGETKNSAGGLHTRQRLNALDYLTQTFAREARPPRYFAPGRATLTERTLVGIESRADFAAAA